MCNNDETDRQRLANARRLLKELDERARLQEEKIARDKGFSSYAEYWAIETERNRQMHAEFEAALDEECKRLGKTRDQYFADHPQTWVGPQTPECDCEGVYSSSA